MKKLVALLLLCLVLEGCSSTVSQNMKAEVNVQTETSESREPKNSYETEDLISESIDNVEYTIPESWSEKGKPLKDGVCYNLDKEANILICSQETDAGYDELSKKDQQNICEQVARNHSNEFTKGEYETFDTYQKDVVTISNSDAYRFKANIMIDNTKYNLNSFVFCVDSTMYIFEFWVNLEVVSDYKDEFVSLQDSIIIKQPAESKSEKAFIDFKETVIDLAKDFKKTDDATAVYLNVIENSYKTIAKMNFEELADSDTFSYFCAAVGYFYNNFDETSNEGELGRQGFTLIERVMTDDGDKQKAQDEIKDTLDLINEGKQEEETEVSDIQGQPIELGAGNYVVGEDIPAGKYDIVGVEAGNIKISSEGKTYADIVSEMIKPDETTYANVKLKDGYTVEVILGGKVKLIPK